MVEDRHVTAELFRRFLDQRVSPAERRPVVRHLITDCQQCVELVGRIATESDYWFPGGALASGEEDYDRAFQAALRFTSMAARRVALERLRGWGQWSALEPLLPEDRLPVVVSRKEYQHWGLYRALLDAARWYSFRDAKKAVDIVRLALDVAELLSPAEAGGEEAAIDLLAKGYAILGNARRLASDLEGARKPLNEAWRLSESGTGDPLEKAQIISLDAWWLRTMGEFETAETALGEALRIYEAAGDSHMQCRTLLQMGNAIGYVDPDKGIAHIQRALELINSATEPRLELCAHHDLAYFLSEAGRPQEALVVLHRARPLDRQFPDEWTQLRLHSIQGRIAHRLGRLAEAGHILRQVWEEFRVRDLIFDMLMVSLDRAECLAAGGELPSATRLVAEIHPILAQWGLRQNLLAAWLVLQQTLEVKRENRELARFFARIALFYRRNWNTDAEYAPE